MSDIELLEGERLLDRVYAHWDRYRGVLHLTTERLLWRGDGLVPPLMEIWGKNELVLWLVNSRECVAEGSSLIVESTESRYRFALRRRWLPVPAPKSVASRLADAVNQAREAVVKHNQRQSAKICGQSTGGA